MILTGINLSQKYTYVSIVKNDGKENSKIEYLNFDGTPALKNSFYYKNKKLLLQDDILSEEDIEVQNYIPNIHFLLKNLYTEEEKIKCENPSVKIERNLENGIIFILLDDKKNEYKKKLEDILTDFFTIIIKEIRKKTNQEDEIVSVIASSDEYNEDQINAIEIAAKSSGIKRVKVLQEVISGALGSCELQRFDFKTKKKVLLCNFGEFCMNLFYLSYENNNFNVLIKEKQKKVKSDEIDKQIFEILVESIEENNPMMLNFIDFLFLEDLAEKVKYHFSGDFDESNTVDFYSVIQSTKFNSVYNYEECDDNMWRASYKEMDLFVDEETFEEVICEPLYEYIKTSCKNIKKKIEKNDKDVKIDYIIFTGALAKLKNFRNIIYDFFNVNNRIQNDFLLTNVIGASYWSERSFCATPNKYLKNFLDSEINLSLIHGIGLKVKIDNYSEPINHIIIPQNTFIPIEQAIELKFRFEKDLMKLTFLEGEEILPFANKIIKEIELKNILKQTGEGEMKGIVDVKVFLDGNYVISVDIIYGKKRLSKKFKYFPVKTLTRKSSNAYFNENKGLKEKKLRAIIAQKIFSFESYYKSLKSKFLKKKYEEKFLKLERFKCFCNSELFELEKLKEIDMEITNLLDL